MQRVRNVDYDDDDLYDEDEDYEEEGGYTQEDRDNFASLTPVVRVGLDEAGIPSTTQEIEESLYHYYWDIGKTVSYLKNKYAPKQSQPPQPKKEKAKSKFDEAQQKSAEKAERTKAGNTTTNGLEKKTEGLKLDAAPVAPSQPKVRSKGLDVPKLWEEEKSKRKAFASFVVIGHVDHGKSTLMGRLLLDTGAVSQRDVDKYKKQATELGKASFALAWVMDTGSEERERGVTVDIAQHHFSTASVDFTILDAPGHRDFVPSMIGGASMADLGLLVVDANQLESGMKGQTKEHILLAHAVGLQKMVVAVNKMDSTIPAWDQNTFKGVSAEIKTILTRAGFTQENIAIVPCSGLTGENVASASAGEAELAWISQNPFMLLQQLERFAPHPISAESVRKPFRMQIADVFRGGITNPLSIAGRISTGNVQVGDVITIQPSGEKATVKGIEVNGSERDWAISTEIHTLHLVGIDQQHIRAGDIACSVQNPIANNQKLTATVQALDSLLPQRVDVHIGRLHVPASISHLVATTDAKGEMLKKKPRIVKTGQRAIVKLSLDHPIPLEAGDRIVVRAEGRTIAAGAVEGTSR